MNDAIKAFYDRSTQAEWTRMERHPLEFEITRRHIDSVLAPASDILDLGGGPGRYAFHYAAAGHRVSLVDLSPGNVEFARAREAETGVALRERRIGDARHLPFLEDESFDLVLCMGPLYHLDEAGRSAAMGECARLVRPGGTIVYAFITTTAMALSLLQKDPGALEAWEPSIGLCEERGTNDPDFDKGFTEAFFVDPLEVAGMIAREGFELDRVAAAEGLAAQSEDKLRALGEGALARWIDYSYRHSRDASLLGASQHVLGIIRKLNHFPSAQRRRR
jgi:S-adenosylmethionine-dependent methyltransferase